MFSMKRILLILSLLAVAITAVDSFATPEGEKVITGDSGFRFASTSALGPVMLEVLADGTATIVIVDSTEGAGTDPNGLKRKWPSGDFGDLTFGLRANIPRPFSTVGTSADSVTVVLGTASEVILTWTNEN